jgi:hypothetical protein
LLVQLVYDFGRELSEQFVLQPGFFDHCGDAANALDRPVKAWRCWYICAHDLPWLPSRG